MANPAPIISQINAFNVTEGTIISFNIVGGTSIVRSNIIYIYDLSDNSLICTHLYISTESIHELPANTDPSIAYASGKSSADFTNGKQYYAQIQTFTNTAGTEGASGASVAKLFWCLVDPTLTINTIPSSISTTSYNVGAVYNSNTTATSNIVQQYQFNLYSATGVLVQSSGVITGSGAQQGTSTAYDLSYNFTGLSVGSSYYITVEVTTTQGMGVSTQSNTFTVSIDTPTLGEATVVNNACDGYISVTSNLSGEYGGSASGSIATFETTSVNEISSLEVTLDPIQDLHGYDHPWVGGAGKNLFNYEDVESLSGIANNSGTFVSTDTDTKTAFAFTVQQYNGSTYVKSNGLNISANGRYYVPITIDSAITKLRIKHNGASKEFRFDYPFTKEGTFCVSLEVTSANPTAVGGVVFKNVMIESGSTMTDYEPYSNLCPISGWDSVEASVVGKNLLATDSLKNGVYISNSNGEEVSYSSWSASEFIPVETGRYRLLRLLDGTYSPISGQNLYWAAYDGNRTYINGGIGDGINIASSTVKYIRVSSQTAYLVSGKGVLCKNSDVDNFTTEADYVDGTTHTATFEETVYGGTVDLVSGVLTVDRAYVDLGTLTWAFYQYGDIAGGYSDGLANLIKRPQGSSFLANAISNSLEQAYDLTFDHVGNGTFSVNAYGRIKVHYDGVSTAQELKTAMNGVQLVYELAEPRTIQLDPQTITTLVGVNNVWANSGDVSVTYNIPITNLLVKRQDTADISGKWLTLYSQPITQASDMDFTFIDFLNQYGKTYKYALVPLLTQEQSGVEVEVEGGYTVSDEVVSIFDGVFVADNTAIYKLKAGVNYGDLSKVQEVGSINTIGSKYPIIVSNSKVDYRTASLSATIVADDYYDNGNLNRMDMVQKRELMESFFTNKRAKILKDWNGNIWLVVFTDNINITFINEYGMGIATLTAAWTEIGDVTSEEDLQNTRIINVG